MSRFTKSGWRTQPDRQHGEPPRRRRRTRVQFRPRLDLLEDRALLSPTTVTSPRDDGSPGTLRSVIAAAPPASTITFAPSLDDQTIKLDPAKGELLINKDLTISGPGAGELTVSGADKVRVFEIGAGSNVKISGLTIAHGYSLADGVTPNSGTGGGLLNSGTLTLKNDVVSDNTADGGPTGVAVGGGLENFDTASVIGTSFLRNVAIASRTNQVANPNYFSGLASGGAIDNSGSNLSVSHSLIANNTASSGPTPSFVNFADGGGISAFAPTTIDSTTITGNTAVCPVTGNPADLANSLNVSAGGGLLIGGSVPVTISNSTVSFNQALSTVPGTGGGQSSGGGIINAGPLTVTNTSFVGNKAVGLNLANGGALEDQGSANISDSSFLGNQAVTTSPATPIQSQPGTIEAEGGAVDNTFDATLIAKNTTFAGNLAQGGSGSGTTNVGGGAVAAGGAIANVDANATLTNCTILANQAVGGKGSAGMPGGVGAGGGIFENQDQPAPIDPISHLPNPYTLTVTGGAIFANAALGGAGGAGANGGDGYGGGIDVGLPGNPNDVIVNVTNSSLFLNLAQGGAGGKQGGTGGNGLGGGLALFEGTTTVQNSQITYNLADGGSPGGQGKGGGIYIAPPAILTTDPSTKVNHNKASTIGNDEYTGP